MSTCFGWRWFLNVQYFAYQWVSYLAGIDCKQEGHKSNFSIPWVCILFQSITNKSMSFNNWIAKYICFLWSLLYYVQGEKETVNKFWLGKCLFSFLLWIYSIVCKIKFIHHKYYEISDHVHMFPENVTASTFYVLS